MVISQSLSLIASKRIRDHRSNSETLITHSDEGAGCDVHHVGVVTHDSADVLDRSATSFHSSAVLVLTRSVRSDWHVLEIVLYWTFQKRAQTSILVVLRGVGLKAVTIAVSRS